MSLNATKLFRLYVADHIATTEGVTRASLGKAAGVSDSYIRRMLEIETQSPQLETAEKIACAMGVSLFEIISPAAKADSLDRFVSYFNRLDDRGRSLALAGMKAEIDLLSSEPKTE